MTTNDPEFDETAGGGLRVTLPSPFTAAKLRRAAFLLESMATNFDDLASIERDEDPRLAAAAVLDDVRAVMLGRGRDHGFKNEIVNLVTLPGGTMGVSVSRRENEAVVAIAFGATGGRSDMRERLGLGIGQQVPAMSYIEITDFDRAGVSHLLGAIKLAFPDMLENAADD